MDYSVQAPAYWQAQMAGRAGCTLEEERCVIDDEHFFVRGLVEIPVLGSDEVFTWGVWVSLSRASFTRAEEVWNTQGREADKPYFGWMSTQLPLYVPDTLNLKTKVHTRPLGRQPYVELEPTGHPLAVEQRTGITRQRVREIAQALLHPER